MRRPTLRRPAHDHFQPKELRALDAPVPFESDLRIEGRLVLFGHEPSPAVVALAERSRRWRISRATLRIVVSFLVAPLVALIPPHAPWAIGALGVGFVLARRSWKEHLSLLHLQAECPRCAANLSGTRGGRLRSPHPITCESCHHELRLEVDVAALA